MRTLDNVANSSQTPRILSSFVITSTSQSPFEQPLHPHKREGWRGRGLLKELRSFETKRRDRIVGWCSSGITNHVISTKGSSRKGLQKKSTVCQKMPNRHSEATPLSLFHFHSLVIYDTLLQPEIFLSVFFRRFHSMAFIQSTRNTSLINFAFYHYSRQISVRFDFEFDITAVCFFDNYKWFCWTLFI